MKEPGSFLCGSTDVIIRKFTATKRYSIMLRKQILYCLLYSVPFLSRDFDSLLSVGRGP